MKEKLTQLLQEGKDRIDAVRSEAELQEVKALLLGKQGSLTGLLKELPKLDAALRPEMGKAVNQAKAQLTALLDQRREEVKLKASEVSPDFDISVPGILPPSGGLHPITQMCYDLNDAFRSMGFEIFEESDITSELYGFDNLNFPPNHPARESMDTYWLEGHDKGECWDKLCLRPHLTGGSVRYMQTHKPPYRFVYPGRVYRNETTDARHERAFFQYEALIVDNDQEHPLQGVRPGCPGADACGLLPLRGARLRDRHGLSGLRRQGLQRVQARGLDRDHARRHAPPQCPACGRAGSG